MKDFAIYKGDTFMFLGNAKECTAELGCSYSTFRFYLTPTYQARLAKKQKVGNPIIVIKLDDEVEENI